MHKSRDKSIFCYKIKYQAEAVLRGGTKLLMQFLLFLPVCNGGFRPLSFVAGNVFMEVGQATGHGLCYVTQLSPGHRVTLQVVCQ